MLTFRRATLIYKFCYSESKYILHLKLNTTLTSAQNTHLSDASNIHVYLVVQQFNSFVYRSKVQFDGYFTNVCHNLPQNITMASTSSAFRVNLRHPKYGYIPNITMECSRCPQINKLWSGCCYLLLRSVLSRI